MKIVCEVLVSLAVVPAIAGMRMEGMSAGTDKAKSPAPGLTVQNGWYVWKGRVVWGNAQHNGWWRAGQRPNITRRAPGRIGPNRTEDLDKLTDNMLRYGYPGFEHCFGLWYDRRRDAHDTARRTDAKVVAPFLEQPWARSGKGQAWDGLPKYDLTRYNPWYFSRLKAFAKLCDRKGTLLIFNFYMQHALLETDAHYVDFPWRPTNCIQATGLPCHNPAANAFYDVSHSVRRQLHEAYIRKCLDELGGFSNVIFSLSEEYTGPASFVKFWLDVIIQWQREKGRHVHIALGGCKDVIDSILAEPKYCRMISSVDLRYWWYQPDGTLYAPQGGKQVPGRYVSRGAAATTPEQIYRQVKEYRLRYPDKAILHQMEASRQQTWAFLAGGGSLLIRYLEYPGRQDPPMYMEPADSRIVLPTYRFIRKYLARSLPKTRPQELVLDHPERNWCLADDERTVLLVYALRGGRFRLDVTGSGGVFEARWFNPDTGDIYSAGSAPVEPGRIVTFTAPDEHDWVLWLTK